MWRYGCTSLPTATRLALEPGEALGASEPRYRRRRSGDLRRPTAGQPLRWPTEPGVSGHWRDAMVVRPQYENSFFFEARSARMHVISRMEGPDEADVYSILGGVIFTAPFMHARTVTCYALAPNNEMKPCRPLLGFRERILRVVISPVALTRFLLLVRVPRSFEDVPFETHRKAKKWSTLGDNMISCGVCENSWTKIEYGRVITCARISTNASIS